MKNKLIIAFAIALVALLGATMASAIVPNYAPYANGVRYGYASYGSHPVNQAYTGIYQNYAYPARAGGWFGQNSAFLIGLRPGINDGPVMNYQTRYAVTSNYYPRARSGGWFGYGNYGYNLRPGTFVYNGGTNYAGSNYYFHGPM